MNTLTNLTSQQLRRAANLKDKLASLQKELGRILGTPAPAQYTATPKRKWTMSAAGRARIAVAARARWAKIKGKKLSVTPVRKAKRKISAAGRKRLAQLAKARWAKAKAAGKKKL
jgi:hypothetical protein